MQRRLFSKTSSSSTSALDVSTTSTSPTSIHQNCQALSLIPQIISFIRHLQIAMPRTNTDHQYIPSTLLIPSSTNKSPYRLGGRLSGREWHAATSELWNEVRTSFALQFGSRQVKSLHATKFLRRHHDLRSKTSTLRCLRVGEW